MHAVPFAEREQLLPRLRCTERCSQQCERPQRWHADAWWVCPWLWAAPVPARVRSAPVQPRVWCPLRAPLPRRLAWPRPQRARTGVASTMYPIHSHTWNAQPSSRVLGMFWTHVALFCSTCMVPVPVLLTARLKHLRLAYKSIQ
jgi:hypothetical protein